jgi:hypothetical protein
MLSVHINNHGIMALSANQLDLQLRNFLKNDKDRRKLSGNDRFLKLLEK